MPGFFPSCLWTCLPPAGTWSCLPLCLQFPTLWHWQSAHSPFNGTECWHLSDGASPTSPGQTQELDRFFWWLFPSASHRFKVWAHKILAIAVSLTFQQNVTLVDIMTSVWWRSDSTVGCSTSITCLFWHPAPCSPDFGCSLLIVKDMLISMGVGRALLIVFFSIIGLSGKVKEEITFLL